MKDRLRKWTKKFLSEFDVKHTVKHTVLTTGLTAVGGPLGLMMGLTYCVGDTVGEMKKFKGKDFCEFLNSLPDDTLKSLIRRMDK